ncbi:sensor histidine kinase [Streptomyces sp. NA04227]|uniref:sensor histidine kinase n=1 Tax=Streptomyces sp. NA04227 TaxID=2742136 RepID=UPI00158FE2AB|nr:histidine kinase [Streptomyces sp. NA04227]QKW10087.1 sensor histidine kinase [Streptomyces sp. NA04227]
MSKEPSAGARAVPEYRWLLPSAVTQELDPDQGRRPRRTVRDWLVDFTMFFLAVIVGLAAMESLSKEDLPSFWSALDQTLGALACAAIWFRRRWPMGLAIAMILLTLLSNTAGGAALVSLFSVAVHRPFKDVAWLAGTAIAVIPVFYAVRPDPELPYIGSVVLGSGLTAAAVGWGMFVRSRRQLMMSLRDRARRAETEAELRAEQAQRLAREAIAREMHDVLAHRLTLLSVHAGALEFRPGAPEKEIARAAGVIRESAHEALQDLREIIGVLRASDGDESGRPQPTLAALGTLVSESRSAGAKVELDSRIHAPDQVPALLGRTAYRIVQEALTNARKHAPGAVVHILVEGEPGSALTVEVRNPPPPGEVPEVPGSGQGLIGLTERAHLAGGRLEHGRERDGGFTVRAWLPWSGP